MTTARRITRERAFQVLYLLECREDLTLEEALTQTLQSQGDEEQTDLVALYELSLPKEFQTKKIASDSLTYVRMLITGVKEHEDLINSQIQQHLKNRSLQRVELINLIILRLSTYELLFESKLSPSIVINEAVELAKIFNDDASSKFVNGILQSILDANQGA